jgi:hypothetical protein
MPPDRLFDCRVGDRLRAARRQTRRAARPIAAGDTGRSADEGYPTAPLKVAGATALGARTGDLPVSVYGGSSWSSWRAGHQRGSACDGHLGCTCGRPLSQLTHLGDLERGLLRRGNRYSAAL